MIVEERTCGEEETKLLNSSVPCYYQKRLRCFTVSTYTVYTVRRAIKEEKVRRVR